MLGPNHKDDCNGEDWVYLGTGYNRVRSCACGAEDHDPDMSDDELEYWVDKLGRIPTEDPNSSPEY